MKWNDLLSFKKKFSLNPPRLSLLLAKEEEERREVLLELLSSWQKGREVALLNEGEGDRFSREVETLPFLTKERVVIVGNFDSLSSEGKKGVAAYLKKPNSWISLLLISKGIDKNHEIYQTIQKSGELLDLAAGKPWEKEPELVRWLIHEGEEAGVRLSQKVGVTLVRAVAGQRALLRRELEKLISFIGKRKEITLEDLQAIVSPTSSETLWELGDAIFAFDSKSALEIAEAIAEEGEGIFLLISHLRSQLRNALLVLSYYQTGGFAAVSEVFPYLKGGLLEKKIALFKNYGEVKLKEGFLLLFEMELKAKDGEVPCMLEQLIIQLAQKRP